jgi:hypothetical protein
MHTALAVLMMSFILHAISKITARDKNSEAIDARLALGFDV